MRSLSSFMSSGAHAEAHAQPEATTSAPILQIAVNIVFGTPFLACLFLAMRGSLWDGFRRLEAGGVAIAAVIWPMTASLGAVWLGASLLLRPVSTTRAATVRIAGALLVLAGSTALALLGR